MNHFISSWPSIIVISFCLFLIIIAVFLDLLRNYRKKSGSDQKKYLERHKAYMSKAREIFERLQQIKDGCDNKEFKRLKLFILFAYEMMPTLQERHFQGDERKMNTSYHVSRNAIFEHFLEMVSGGRRDSKDDRYIPNCVLMKNCRRSVYLQDCLGSSRFNDEEMNLLRSCAVGQMEYFLRIFSGLIEADPDKG